MENLMRIKVLIMILLGGAALGMLLWQQSHRPDDQLTRLHSDELEAVLNHYFALLQTQAAFEQPQVYCQEVATGDELSRCITTQSIRTFHDTNEVVRFRVIDYRQTCAVTMAVFTTMGSTSTDSFLLEKEDNTWKIAGRANAVGQFNQSRPHLPFGCH
jgi:hypothetical protein